MLLMGGVAAAAVIGYFTADLPTAHDLVTVPVSLTTRIYDRSGEHLLYTLEDERRELIGLDSVPKMMQDATIAIEDKSFWTNPGIDIGGIIRALNANAASGTISQGGSTITQQLIKTRLLSDEPTFTRKIKEAILALEATRTFSKAQILEMYLNQIYYGNQAYGIEAAAQYFFSVPASKLNLPQSALLAGLVNSPSFYDPVANPKNSLARRNQVLGEMLKQKMITKTQHDAAVKSGVGVKVKPSSAVLMAAIAPVNVMVVSFVPVPVVMFRPAVPASVSVPLVAVSVTCTALPPASTSPSSAATR